ncbi:unnamed protein product [Acanthoscelides obtectus]|uniref:Uncharacterized protein n=1 Tax=Acanthoscelides obtectus TaxID=200917 RepID=A0A9P0PH56_ACAOB|nr:unnamed protein product [Acanthoscelides obtectus]CAK1644015.1 hypothetical protein AOBTE_LOCUS13777 [Acanthoscelides obtectus]
MLTKSSFRNISSNLHHLNSSSFPGGGTRFSWKNKLYICKRKYIVYSSCGSHRVLSAFDQLQKLDYKR